MSDHVEAIREEIQSELDREWATGWAGLVPGTLLLEKLLARSGFSFNKAAGDTARLAGLIEKAHIDPDISTMLDGFLGNAC